MQHLPASLAHVRRLSAGLMTIVLATTATLAPAQTIPRQPLADSTHTYRNLGVPNGKDPVCNAGFVLSGQQCVPLSSGTGATLLPYNVPQPQDVYVNRASYPLLVVVSPNPSSPGCFHFWAYVDWQEIAHMSNGCDSGPGPLTFIVPSGSSFRWNSDSAYTGTARVTALANDAKWKDIGIFFWVVSGTNYVYSYSNGCWEYGTTYTTYISSYGDVTTNPSYGRSYTCPIDAGGGA